MGNLPEGWKEVGHISGDEAAKVFVRPIQDLREQVVAAYEKSILQSENGLLWRMDHDGNIWASWFAWNYLEDESPLFVQTIDARLQKEAGKS